MCCIVYSAVLQLCWNALLVFGQVSGSNMWNSNPVKQVCLLTHHMRNVCNVNILSPYLKVHINKIDTDLEIPCFTIQDWVTHPAWMLVFKNKFGLDHPDPNTVFWGLRKQHAAIQTSCPGKATAKEKLHSKHQRSIQKMSYLHQKSIQKCLTFFAEWRWKHEEMLMYTLYDF